MNAEKNCTKPDPTSQHTAKTIAPSYGAFAFTSILKPYLCQVGPWKGWTKLPDADLRGIINKHLRRDGNPEISRSTFYRWKRQAIDAGFVEFSSDAKRRRKRNRCQRGRWMTVLAVPISTPWRTGRPTKKRETFGALPKKKRETFGAHIEISEKSKNRDPEGRDFVGEKISVPKEPKKKTPVQEWLEQAKAEREEKSRKDPLRWDSEAEEFIGDKSKLRAAVQRYHEEFGDPWVQANWLEVRDFIRDNPEKAPRGDAFAYVLGNFRRAAKWRRMDLYQREETPAERIERQSAEKWARVGCA